ncbi:unnamed protein product [Tenebrio molitor]|nr:unnamed protein product [Tenebrio molitor]
MVVGPSFRVLLWSEKSKGQYEKYYSDFRDWCNKKNVKTVSKNIVFSYLGTGIYLLWKVNAILIVGCAKRRINQNVY